MSNMHYCMFENTTKDLRDCYEELGEKQSLSELSESEKKYAIKLYDLAKDYVELFEDVFEKEK